MAKHMHHSYLDYNVFRWVEMIVYFVLQGDVWAETSMLGFLWHYYACMEGKVYDITEWVACKVMCHFLLFLF